MTDILGLDGVRVTASEEDTHHFHINVDPVGSLTQCPKCGGRSLYKHDRREVMIRDQAIRGKQVAIYVNRQRWRCQSCGAVAHVPIESIDDNRSMTKRLLAWIRKESLRRTFAQVAEEVGVVEGTVRHIFREYASELEKTVRFEAPQMMGIDEIHILKKPRCVIGNIAENTIVDILPTRTKDAVTKYLYSLEGRDQVRYATLDMWRPYRDAIELVMPQATIVVDKFHVVRMANDALEKVRKKHRAMLEPKVRRQLVGDRFTLLKRPGTLKDKEQLILSGWLRNFPLLSDAYTAKEAFFDIYEAETRHEAERRYEAWRNSIPESIAAEFSDVVRAVDNWHPYVFAYHDHRLTNAFSESVNNLIRLMNRLGRGYSFDALRAKILFTDRLHKRKPPRLMRRRQSQPVAAFAMEMTRDIRGIGRELPPNEDIRPRNMGVDIPTLIRLLEDDRF